MSLKYLLDPRLSMIYAIHRHYTFLPFRNLVIVTLYMAIPIVSGVAWWTVWKKKPSAKRWAIAASITYILIFLQPVIFFPSSAWWRSWHIFLLGIMGLRVFLRPAERVPQEPASA